MRLCRYFLGALPALLLMLIASVNANVASDNLLSHKYGAHIRAFSSEYGSGWEASNLIEDESVAEQRLDYIKSRIWSSAPNAPFPHYVEFEWEKPVWITTLAFNNYLEDETDHPGISAKQIELYTYAKNENKHVLASFVLEKNKPEQYVQIAPTELSRLGISIVSNYGHPWYTELGLTQAFDDGSRPDNLGTRLAKKEAVDLYGIYFDFGKASLRPESAKVISELSVALLQHPTWQLVIEGHTDNVGAAAFNQTLSQQRAMAVEEALIRNGIANERLSAFGYGSAHPILPNTSEQNRAKNRRVTVRVTEQKNGMESSEAER